VTEPLLRRCAEAAYRGYATATGGYTHDGRLMPAWENLPDRTVTAWIAAVAAALTAHAAVDVDENGAPDASGR
jgi:hypothetical protein